MNKNLLGEDIRRNKINARPKIAFVTNFAAHYSIKFFELLAARYDVEFFFTGGQEDYWDKKNKTWVGNFKGKYLKGFFIFPKIKITAGLFTLPVKQYDIFIKTIDDRFSLPFIFFLTKIQRKPFVLWTGLWSHPRTFFHILSQGLVNFIYRHSDAIIVYGKHVKRYLLKLGVEEDKIFYAWHSIDNRAFDKQVTDKEKSEIKIKLGLSDEKIALYVGRLEEGKGLNYLIKAVSMIKDLKVVVLFIGSGSKKYILEKECQKRNVLYRFLGHIPNEKLYCYYALAEVFILPSVTTRDFKEPWGLVINEAMNQGCPIIATDAVGAAVGGLMEHGKNGFVVPEKDSLALKKALETLLKDEALRCRMGLFSKKKIEDWSQEGMVKGFAEAVEYVFDQSIT